MQSWICTVLNMACTYQFGLGTPRIVCTRTVATLKHHASCVFPLAFTIGAVTDPGCTLQAHPVLVLNVCSIALSERGVYVLIWGGHPTHCLYS
jgi:hypothetical protein